MLKCLPDKKLLTHNLTIFHLINTNFFYFSLPSVRRCKFHGNNHAKIIPYKRLQIYVQCTARISGLQFHLSVSSGRYLT